MSDTQQPNSIFADMPEDPANPEASEYSVNEFGETVCSMTLELGSPGGKEHEKPNSLVSDVPRSIGRYQIHRMLGRGAFGAVYLGHDDKLQRDVAIKVPLLDSAGMSAKQVEESFLQEARQVACIQHPNVVTVHDVGAHDAKCFIVSEYLEGKDLNHWMIDRTPTWEETVGIVASVADGLAAAHAKGVVHRDVKPSNILMAQRGDQDIPIVVDFGLALSDSSSAMPGRKRGHIAGTPNFMAPEQARGEGHRIDGRTDIYSLGVVLYRMLCGQLPFKASSIAELLQTVIQDEPRPPRQFVRGIPRDLEKICLKAMSKAINDRYTTATDFAEDLRKLLKTEPAPPPEKADKDEKKKKKKKEKKKSGIKILIAEDNEVTRFKLQSDLERWGHEVTAAEDGKQAWEMFQKDSFSIVITDWMMPNMSGLELVQQIRSGQEKDYVYVLMLTAKSEKHDIVAGMGAGADDFLAKPFHRDELNVRLRAGLRIVKMNRDLSEANRRMRSSLEAAAEIQRSYLPSNLPSITGVEFSWAYKPGDELGGDMLNIVPLDADHVGIYILDVNGNGVPASLLATTVARAMGSRHDVASILFERDEDDEVEDIREPEDVALALNRRFASGQGSKQFFTLLYGILNVGAREFTYVSAGHPPMVHQVANGAPEFLQGGGLPIGMAPENDDYYPETIQLSAGDRLLIYSDGLGDAVNGEDQLFGSSRLMEYVRVTYNKPLPEMINGLMAELKNWRAGAKINDDVAVMAIEMK